MHKYNAQTITAYFSDCLEWNLTLLCTFMYYWMNLGNIYVQG